MRINQNINSSAKLGAPNSDKQENWAYLFSAASKAKEKFNGQEVSRNITRCDKAGCDKIKRERNMRWRGVQEKIKQNIVSNSIIGKVQRWPKSPKLNQINKLKKYEVENRKVEIEIHQVMNVECKKTKEDQ